MKTTWSIAARLAGMALLFAAAQAPAQWGADAGAGAGASASERDREPPLRRLFAPLRAAGAVPATYPLSAQVTQILTLLADSRLTEASAAANAALKLDTANSALHLLNGLVYHLMAMQGDVSKADTALEGYRTAVRLAPDNWVAHEFVGLAHLEKREYRQALAAFAEVLLLRPDDTDVLYRAMAAAYLGGEPAVACAMADRLKQLPAPQHPRGFLRASVLVYAACADTAAAQDQKSRYLDQVLPVEELRRIELRLADWQHEHRRKLGTAKLDEHGRPLDAVRLQAQLSPPAPDAGATGAAGPANASNPYGPQPAGAYGPLQQGMQQGAVAGSGSTTLPERAPSSGTDRMVLLDVVMIRTEDAVSTAKGVNLLSALNLQFGGANLPAYSRVSASSQDGGRSTIIGRAISVPALTYTLNIANANNNLNEVLARPTITALEGVRSEFFSGTVLNAAVVSAGSNYASGSVSVEKRYGVRLALLPQILDNGMVRLAIDASRTFLKPPSSDIAFTYKLEISEILVNANVVMRLGDTLILSGLSERESTSVRDGVPLLQDVPLAQYLFSRQTQSEYQKSVLILITPRPAAYTWLSDETREAVARKPDAFSPSLDALRARYGDWFKPYPNLASVFHHFNAAELYRKFRTGDVTIDSWERMDSTRQRLKSALEFLHF
jgi:tetratricopeptide (TPR) repeat protein